MSGERCSDVSDDVLRTAVESSHSWRGVLRLVGLPASSSHHSRALRERCEALDIGYLHFTGQRTWTDADLVAAAEHATTWSELMGELGYADLSGSARASIRRQADLLGIQLVHLDPRHAASPAPLRNGITPGNVRRAGPVLVAALLTLRGSDVSWPLEPVPYDLVVDSGTPRMSRVQVKTATRRAGGTYICFITRSRYVPQSRWPHREKYSREAVDAFGIVDGDLSVYMIPFDVVGDRSAIHVRRYERFLVGRLPVPSMYASHAPGRTPGSGL